MMQFGLVGKKLGHSFSKGFFSDFFRQQDIDARYENYELATIDEVTSLLQGNLSGFNVTIPYKEAIIPFLDELSEDAQAIGAVNCVELIHGKAVGHNTDAFGFHQSIKPFLTNQHERAMILGTGGASKAVAHVLRSIGIDLIYISRHPKGNRQFSYDAINDHMLNACKLIVNTTPVGMFPDTDACIELPFEHLTDKHLVVDLIYNPVKTQLLLKSEAAGATILNGETMLKQQALKSWEIWNKNQK